MFQRFFFQRDILRFHWHVAFFNSLWVKYQNGYVISPPRKLFKYQGTFYHEKKPIGFLEEW